MTDHPPGAGPARKWSVTDVRVEDAGGTDYIQLKKVRYTLNGRARSWDVAMALDSVAVLLWVTDRRAFVLVRQFRPPVYLHNGDGLTWELPAGIIDRAASPAEVAAAEVAEETGYLVTPEELRPISSFYTSVGVLGTRQTLFYAEVTSDRRQLPGGGVEEEDIEVVHLPLADVAGFLRDETRAKPPALMFAFLWWQARQGTARFAAAEKSQPLDRS